MFRCLSMAVAILITLWLVPASTAQNPLKLPEKKLMTAEEYTALLNRVERDLAGWQAELSAVDPGKGNPSYETGKQIEAEKLVALGAVNSAYSEISQLRTKKTIYEELALADSVDTISFFFGQLSFLGVFNDVSMTSVNKDAAELGAVEMMLKNDGMQRLRLLESSSCSPSTKQ